MGSSEKGKKLSSASIHLTFTATRSRCRLLSASRWALSFDLIICPCEKKRGRWKKKYKLFYIFKNESYAIIETFNLDTAD